VLPPVKFLPVQLFSAASFLTRVESDYPLKSRGQKIRGPIFFINSAAQSFVIPQLLSNCAGCQPLYFLLSPVLLVATSINLSDSLRLSKSFFNYF
jgi:hypothetical protein